jgi:hypothetical protein
MITLKEAAQAVLDRWDSPRWEWDKQGATADLMATLRTAIEQAEKQEPVAPDDESICDDWISASDSDGIAYDGPSFECGYKIGRIAERDAQPEQEPVGEVLNERGEVDYISHVPPVETRLYTTPFAARRKKEHITNGDPCWCNPEIDYVDPETGVAVIVHKEPQ